MLKSDLVEVATGLEHDDVESLPGEDARNHPAAGAGTGDHDVGIELEAVAVRGQRTKFLGALLWS